MAAITEYEACHILSECLFDSIAIIFLSVGVDKNNFDTLESLSVSL